MHMKTFKKSFIFSVVFCAIFCLLGTGLMQPITAQTTNDPLHIDGERTWSSAPERPATHYVTERYNNTLDICVTPRLDSFLENLSEEEIVAFLASQQDDTSEQFALQDEDESGQRAIASIPAIKTAVLVDDAAYYYFMGKYAWQYGSLGAWVDLF